MKRAGLLLVLMLASALAGGCTEEMIWTPDPPGPPAPEHVARAYVGERMIADGDGVVWMEFYEVLRVREPDGPVEVIATSESEMSDLALVGDRAFWFEDLAGTCDLLRASNPDESVQTECSSHGYGLRAVGETLFWLQGGFMSDQPWQLMGAAIADLETFDVWLADSDEDIFDFELTSEATWIDGRSDPHRVLHKADPFDLAAPSTELVAGDYVELATVGSTVYLGDGASVTRLDADGTYGELATGTPQDLTADGDHVYWRDSACEGGDECIRRAGDDGVIEIVTDGKIAAFDVGETHIYWSDDYDIWRIEKP